MTAGTPINRALLCEIHALLEQTDRCIRCHHDAIFHVCVTVADLPADIVDLPLCLACTQQFLADFQRRGHL